MNPITSSIPTLALRPLEITTGVRRVSWREIIATFYRHQQRTTEINRNGRICSIKDDPQVGKVHKYLIDEAVKSRKRRKTAASWYYQESFNPVLNPHLRTEISHFLLSYWVHTDRMNHFMNV
jgi:hypothetical protein